MRISSGVNHLLITNLLLLLSFITFVLAAPQGSTSTSLSRRATGSNGNTGKSGSHKSLPDPEYPFVDGEPTRQYREAQKGANECVDKCWKNYLEFRKHFLLYPDPWPQLERRDRNSAQGCTQDCARLYNVPETFVKTPTWLKGQPRRPPEQVVSNGNGRTDNNGRDAKPARPLLSAVETPSKETSGQTTWKSRAEAFLSERLVPALRRAQGAGHAPPVGMGGVRNGVGPVRVVPVL